MDACQPTGSVATAIAMRASPHPTQRFARWFVEARAHRVICLVLGVWLINIFDLTLTVIAHRQGILVEQNPLARRLLQDGVMSIILYKVGMVCIGSYPLLRFRTTRIVEIGAVVVLLAYALVAFRWHSCYDVYLNAGDTHPAVVQRGAAMECEHTCTNVARTHVTHVSTARPRGQRTLIDRPSFEHVPIDATRVQRERIARA